MGGSGERKGGEEERDGKKGERRGKGREGERDLAPQKKNPGAATESQRYTSIIRAYAVDHTLAAQSQRSTELKISHATDFLESVFSLLTLHSLSENILSPCFAPYISLTII